MELFFFIFSSSREKASKKIQKPQSEQWVKSDDGFDTSRALLTIEFMLVFCWSLLRFKFNLLIDSQILLIAELLNILNMSFYVSKKNLLGKKF